jgi:hypothetical protein
VLSFEDKFKDITVDSVWLIKKTKQDDGFQEWHQDMKIKITTTIVVNVGSGVNVDMMSLTETKEESKNVAEMNKGEKDMSTTETKKNDNNVAETNEDDEDEDDVLDVEVIPPGWSRIYERRIPFLWLMVGNISPSSILGTHICFAT